MDAKESSPARGLKNMLAKSKRNKDGLETSGPDPGSPVRNSSDTVLGKIKARIGTVDDDVLGDGRISKLVPTLGKRRDRKRFRAHKFVEDSTEELRGRSGKGSASNSLGTSDSLTTLNDERGSLLTSDSEGETTQESTAIPPPLLSHESHSGYLTSTSPEIESTTIPASPAFSQLNGSSPKTVQPSSRTATLPMFLDDKSQLVDPVVGSSPIIDISILGKSYSGQPAKLDTSPQPLAAPLQGGRRGLSQADSSQGELSNDDGLRRSASPGISGSLGREKTSSLSSRRASKASEREPSLRGARAMGKNAGQSYTSLPPIMTIRNTPSPSELLDAPATTVTPSTPVDGRGSERQRHDISNNYIASLHKDPTIITSPSGTMISHRRVRSDSASHTPSKLSQATTAPLTPTLEEAKISGSRAPSGTTTLSGGFFSSVFSAAQNAANTLSNSLANNTTRPRSATFQALPTDDARILKTTEDIFKGDEHAVVEPIKPLAIDTIGSGELSLSHLGISSESETVAQASARPGSPAADGARVRSRSGTVVRREEAAARAEDLSAARAVSAAYDDKTAGKPASTPVAEDTPLTVQPLSTYEQSVVGEKTPPNGSIYEGENNSLWRSGSLRHKVDRAKRRHRKSSGATTVGTIIATTHGASMSPSNGSTPKMTGFAVASKKRNRDFHQLFRSVPEDDYLIEDYSCALQRDIILAGRIYISEGHVCFSSNILGWVTTLVISFDEVVSVEKENTAVVFPNAIAVQTLHARHTFRSLLSRDTTYDLLIGIWKINHPSLQSSENGVRLFNGGTGSKTEKVEIDESDDGSEESEMDGDVYDEDDEEEDDRGAGSEQSLVGTREGSIADSDAAESLPKSAVARKPSALGIAVGQASGATPTVSESKAAEKAGIAAASSADFPGPATHAPTECSDNLAHYEKILKDEVVPAPLGKVYSMIFGAASGGFMTRWLLDEVKVTDLQMKDDEKGLTEDNKTRSFSYIKPLNASIGPRSTKCVITEQLEAFDLDKAITVSVVTQTPDVPSGNVFSTKTKYCLMWGPSNGTRVIMCCMIEWTGKSWIKGAIEKGANDGQTTYANDLMKALRSGVFSRSRANTSGSKVKRGRKRKGDGETVKSVSGISSDQKKSSGWGLLEPLHMILGRVSDVCMPLINANSVICMLLFLLIVSWFRNSRVRYASPTHPSHPSSMFTTPQRIAAYEEIWRTEEEALWDWLEERVGTPSRLVPPARQKREKLDQNDRQYAKRRTASKTKYGDGPGTTTGGVKPMGEREIQWAIGVTEDKLKRLKQAMGNGKNGQRGSEEVSHKQLKQLEELVKDEL